MEGQPLYEIGDILKPNTQHMGYEVLPKAILIIDLIWYESAVIDVYWAYKYVDLTTNLHGESSCYRVDNYYNKVA